MTEKNLTAPAAHLPVSKPEPPRAPASAPRVLGWLVMALFLASLFIPGLYFAQDDYWLPLFTKWMALALFALSVDLVWGYTGLLSLGQGLYFGLGVYAVGYSLKLQEAATAADLPVEVSPDMALPNFMEYCRLPAVPPYIAPLIHINLAVMVA